jgi:transposase-like protein
MPSRYSVEVRRQVVEPARSGTRVAQLAETFGMTQASIYSWLKQDRIDRGEAPGLSTEGRWSSRQQRDGFASLRANWRGLSGVLCLVGVTDRPFAVGWGLSRSP